MNKNLQFFKYTVKIWNRKNNFAEELKNLTKYRSEIILLNYQNYYVEMLMHNKQCCKKF